MKKKKMSNCIKFIIFIFPLLLFAFSTFRDGNLDIISVEYNFAIFRRLDFGLFDFFNSEIIGSQSDSIAVLLLMVDLLIYYLYFKLFDLIYSCFGVFIDLIRSFFEHFGGER